MAYQIPKNNPFSPHFNLGWRNHPNFLRVVDQILWAGVSFKQLQPISHPFNSYQRPAFQGVPNAPRSPPLIA